VHGCMQTAIPTASGMYTSK